MKGDDHPRKARRLEASAGKLISSGVDDSELACEGFYGAAQHYLSHGLERRLGRHIDTHEGMSRLLRRNDFNEIAVAFDRLDVIRHGQWYGRKGNGDVAKEASDLVSRIRRWAVEE